ncbi:GIY-YIG nuclease family protein [Aliiglaciecola sp. 2_MG-2023]|uniref:GIY-YIG nuclease family protein n=1 Tax=unclassified Aliiglaciecola TaxID=2593648 RepID=UPI0026E3A21F|nr:MULTISPECIES: GIY-YIG nuclease family protein [unclassified Aliiglaciecola]MDO6709166.1 GIY-YIG nuclease family protein [Aliiglaciecola sp. 2_MG-2023]MDO6750314.1 GIY-YIG nuclease family protein [Aliiglaciecola sp. 1_MG-2023]
MVEKQWSIYMIENRLGMNYCGICTDLSRRFYEHASNSKRCAKALRGKGPLVLKYAAIVGDHSSALKLEYWFKKQSRTTKLKIIKGQLNLPSDPIKVEQSQLNELQQQIENKLMTGTSPDT